VSLPANKVSIILANWREEIVVARVYDALAASEPDAHRKDLLQRMAESEYEHARLWEERLKEIGVEVDHRTIEAPLRKQLRMLRMFGPDAMIRRIEHEERHHVAEYQDQIARLGDEASMKILELVIPDEEVHAQKLHIMAHQAETGPRSRLDTLLAREKWHAHGAASWIGDAIYGINDGLGAVFGIVSAVAGATSASPKFVLIAGLAGMIGSAFSMGSSAFLAAKSKREVHESEIERERMEIENDPDHECEELELMYQLKGFTEPEAQKLVERLTSNKDVFLQTMVREELGINEELFPNPWTSSGVAGLSTAIGAFLPIIPFFYTSGMPAVWQSLIISVVAHFAVGASKTFVTGRSWVKQGLEMTFVGMVGGALAYGFGLLLGTHGGLGD